MNTAFTTTSGIVDTTKNVLNYMKNNVELFWHYLKPYLPYLIGAHIFGLGLSLAGLKLEGGQYGLGDVFASYFITCFAMTWHRVIIFGPQRTVTVNPLRLQRHEFQFLIVGVGIGFAIFLAGGLGGFLASKMGILGSIIMLALILGILYAVVRLALYFPAKAVNADITLAQAFALSKGYFWRIVGTNAAVTAVLFVPLFLAALVVVTLSTILAHGPETVKLTIETIIMLPLNVLLVPFMAAASVVVLSNFYMDAVRN